MKRLILLAAVLSACGSFTEPLPPETQVRYVLDKTTCQTSQAVRLDFFSSDGKLGDATISAGDSAQFPFRAGIFDFHVQVGSTKLWPMTGVVVKQGYITRFVLQCF